jgi:hypothetical protein
MVSQILLGAKWLRAAPNTSGARLKWLDPDGIPIASWRAEKFVNLEKVSGAAQVFSQENRGCLSHSCAEPLSPALAARPLQPFRFLVPVGILGLQLFLDRFELGTQRGRA